MSGLRPSEFTKALGYYQDAVTACPTSAQAQLNVARAYEALGDRDQAMDYYKRAIQAAPSDHDAAPAFPSRRNRRWRGWPQSSADAIEPARTTELV